MSVRTTAAEPLRIGILGCADIAIRRMIPVLTGLKSARLVAVASRDGERARRIGERIGCAGVAGYDTLLGRDDIDAVYVPLPPGLHHHWVRGALLAGKHVLCEKPMCTTHGEALEMIELARDRGLVLAENFMFLHHRQHREVDSLVREGVTGDLQVFESSFAVPPLDPSGFRYRPELGGGALLDVGVYPLRAAQLHLAGEPEVLAATLRVDNATGVDVAGGALLCSQDGVTAHVTFGFQHAYRSRYVLWGTTGRIEVERAFTPPEHLKPPVRIVQQDRLTELAMPADNQVRNAAEHFVDTVLDSGSGPVGETTTLRQARLIDDIRKIAKTFHRE